jgi:hypothetical protein
MAREITKSPCQFILGGQEPKNNVLYKIGQYNEIK